MLLLPVVLTIVYPYTAAANHSKIAPRFIFNRRIDAQKSEEEGRMKDEGGLETSQLPSDTREKLFR